MVNGNIPINRIGIPRFFQSSNVITAAAKVNASVKITPIYFNWGNAFNGRNAVKRKTNTAKEIVTDIFRASFIYI